MIVDCASMMTSAAAITRNEIIRATAISCCFLELYSQTPRLTGTFAVSSDSAGYSSTITEKRHEHRAAADPVVRLLRGWIALPRGGGSEAHIRRALVVVAGSASLWAVLGHNILYIVVGFTGCSLSLRAHRKKKTSPSARTLRIAMNSRRCCASCCSHITCSDGSREQASGCGNGLEPVNGSCSYCSVF